MNCPEFEEHLADYLADELPATDRNRVAEHLGSCRSCREETDALRATLRALERLDTVSPSEAAARTAGLRVVRRRSLPVRWAWSCAKTAAVLAVGVGLGRYMTTSAPATPRFDNSQPAGQADAPVQEDRLHPQWIELGRKVGGGHSTLASQLVTLAHAVH